ncbi:hypothetical protein [Amycolatopsis sp. NPDC051102]
MNLAKTSVPVPPAGMAGRDREGRSGRARPGEPGHSRPYQP